MIAGTQGRLIGLRRRLGTAQLRHEQIGRGPGQEQADENANDCVAAQGLHNSSLPQLASGVHPATDDAPQTIAVVGNWMQGLTSQRTRIQP